MHLLHAVSWLVLLLLVQPLSSLDTCRCEGPPQPSLDELANRYRPTKFLPWLHTGYHRVYDTLLAPLRHAPVRLLEIGLDSGNGTLLWKEYFDSVELFGIDSNPDTGNTPGARLAQIFIGDASNATFLQEVMRATGGNFDVIIDDGGHSFTQQMEAYKMLFTHALKPGGIYVIEDIETSYWRPGTVLYGQPIAGGRLHPRTTVNKFKQMVDVVNRKFHDNNYYVTQGATDWWVKSVAFAQNLVILHKKDARDRPYDAHYRWPAYLQGPARHQGKEEYYGPSVFAAPSPESEDWSSVPKRPGPKTKKLK